MVQTKKRVGRPPGFIEPQTVRKKAIDLLKETMLDVTYPIDTRIKAAGVLLQNPINKATK